MSDISNPQQQSQPQGLGVDLRRIIKEVSKEARKSKIPLYIAVLATLLAFISMAEGDAKERALGAQIEASNQFAFFQAKNIRKTDSEIAADVLRPHRAPTHDPEELDDRLAGDLLCVADEHADFLPFRVA